MTRILALVLFLILSGCAVSGYDCSKDEMNLVDVAYRYCTDHNTTGRHNGTCESHIQDLKIVYCSYRGAP